MPPAKQSKVNTDPYSFGTDFGGVLYHPNKTADLVTNYQPYQREAYDKGNQKAYEYLDGMNTNLGVNDYYDNPFYASTKQYLSDPIQRQYQQDERSLSNNLSAKGLVGGSYDAYRRNLMDQSRDYNLSQAELMGRNMAADYMTRSQQDRIAGLTAARGDTNNLLNQFFKPAEFAIAAQQSVNPLIGAAVQQSAANQQNNGGFLNSALRLGSLAAGFIPGGQAVGAGLGLASGLPSGGFRF